MKSSTKAALLSGLIFPGAGQLWLKHYRRGLALLVITIAAFYFVIADAAQQAQGIADKIQRGEIPLDPDAISQAIAASNSSAGSLSVTIAWLIITVAWIVGIVDAFRSGRQRDSAL